MTDHAVYLYAVADAELAESDAVLAIRGVNGSPVRVVVEGGLAAVVSSVSAERFSEESLRRCLEDLRWLEDTARAHNAVVDSLARTHAVAPVRMATVYVDDANVRALLRENAAGFAAALERIRGRTEWGVKGFAVHDTNERQAQVPAAAGPGTSYLMQRRAERDHAAIARERSFAAADAVHNMIAELAVASRRYPPQDPRLSKYEHEMVLNAAYLVDDAAADSFRQALDRMDTADIRLELTGPWAPYSFATLDRS